MDGGITYGKETKTRRAKNKSFKPQGTKMYLTFIYIYIYIIYIYIYFLSIFKVRLSLRFQKVRFEIMVF
jgi:hypothetical protein